jgi:hypothetical protein
MKKTILLTILFVLLASVSFAQVRTKLTRPCPSTTTAAKVEIDSSGNINIVPCSGGSTSVTSLGLVPLTLTAANSGQVPLTLQLASGQATNAFQVKNFANANIARFNKNGSLILDNGNGFSTLETTRDTGFVYYDAAPRAYAGSVYGVFLSPQNSTATNSKTTFGAQADVYFSGTGTGHQVTGLEGIANADSGAALVANAYGLKGSANIISANGATKAFGGYFLVQGSAGVTASAYGIQAQLTPFGSNSITNGYGINLSGWSGSITNSYGIYADTSIDRGSVLKYFIYSLSTSPNFFSGKNTFDTTDTTAGTTGNQTINKPSFSVNFAAGTASLTVTNSFIVATSYVLCTVQTNDTTALLKNATPAAGSVVIRLNANATAETRVACMVVN